MADTIYLIRTANGTGYYFAGQVGDIIMTTPDTLPLDAAVAYGRLIAGVAHGVDVRLSNCDALDPVARALRGGR